MCDYSLKTCFVEAMKYQNPILRKQLDLTEYKIPRFNNSQEFDPDEWMENAKTPNDEKLWRLIAPREVRIMGDEIDGLYAIIDLITLKNGNDLEVWDLNRQPIIVGDFDIWDILGNPYKWTPRKLTKNGVNAKFVVKGGEFKVE
jgi:hypothetical protein